MQKVTSILLPLQLLGEIIALLGYVYNYVSILGGMPRMHTLMSLVLRLQNRERFPLLSPQ